MPKQFDVEFKQRAVRLVNDRLDVDQTMSSSEPTAVPLQEWINIALECSWDEPL